jgi:predicted enzyme related to lactoylglutathione lyase
MLQKLRTVVYHVSDLQKAKEWYIQLTGIQPYFDEPFYVGFNVNGCELGLDPDMTGVEKGNHTVAYWAVNSIEKCVADITEIGGTIKNAIQDVGGGTKIAVLEDLWGNAIGLIEATA